MTSKTESAPKKTKTISESDVLAFLKAHPHFLNTHSAALADLTPPEQNLGGGIVDFQHYLLKNLQKDKSDLKSRYDVLVDFCRDNMSVQAQVHAAALRLMRTRSLEQLLEAVTIDLMSLFNVDVVRLAIESDHAVMMDSQLGNPHYSGIVFIPHGTIDYALGPKKNIALIDSCTPNSAGVGEIFSDCMSLVGSCALLRLMFEQLPHHVVLAFGVRHAGRFHPGQGVELLQFLAQIVTHQLERYMDELEAD